MQLIKVHAADGQLAGEREREEEEEEQQQQQEDQERPRVARSGVANRTNYANQFWAQFKSRQQLN